MSGAHRPRELGVLPDTEHITGMAQGGKHRSVAAEDADEAAAINSASSASSSRSTVPDQIEVIEYGSTKFNSEARAVNRAKKIIPPDASALQR